MKYLFSDRVKQYVRLSEIIIFAFITDVQKNNSNCVSLFINITNELQSVEVDIAGNLDPLKRTEREAR